MKVNNSSWMSDEVVGRILTLAAAFVGVVNFDYPIYFRNLRADWKLKSEGVVTNNRKSKKIVKYVVRIPARKALNSSYAPKDFDTMALAKCIISTAIHEFTHILDLQNGEVFSYETSYGRRPKWNYRPEERRAIANQKRAEDEKLYDLNWELVCDVVAEIENQFA